MSFTFEHTVDVPCIISCLINPRCSTFSVHVLPEVEHMTHGSISVNRTVRVMWCGWHQVNVLLGFYTTRDTEIFIFRIPKWPRVWENIINVSGERIKSGEK